tara:strand:- start:1148 stop:1252 length:105 start_codon:yes stop_codon:yes gene_type:complete
MNVKNALLKELKIKERLILGIGDILIGNLLERVK